MEEKDSEMSGPHEEFRICFCGKVPFGFVGWYLIDVSVEEACLSEKTESSTRKLIRFSESEHLSSYAALGGRIYSLGGQHRSSGGGDTLLNHVWLLNFKYLEDLKLVPGRKPQLQKSPTVLSHDEAQAQPQKAVLFRSHDEAQAQSQKSVFIRGPDKARGPDEAQAQSQKSVVIRGPDKAQAQSQKSVVIRGPDETLEQKLSFEDLPGAGYFFNSYARSWKPMHGLSMNFARYKPHTMVVDHKLYVLGGFLPNQNQADGWIEVFDPEEGKWESLPSPPDEFQIHSSIMISGLLKSKKEIIIAKQRRGCHPLLFFSYNITTRCWDSLVRPNSELSVHSNVERAVILPPNIGRAVTVGNTLYWISTEEDNDECTIRAYDLDRNIWFEGHLNTATIFGDREEYFSSIYSRGPGFLHLVDQKFCLLLQSSVTKDPQPSIEYLYCVILNISPIYEHDWGKFEFTTVSIQKYSMDHYIDFLDCMLLDRVSGVESVDCRGQSTSTTSVSSRIREDPA